MIPHKILTKKPLKKKINAGEVAFSIPDYRGEDTLSATPF
jgi:hypothetical protein